MFRSIILLKMKDLDVDANNPRSSTGLHAECLSNIPALVTYQLDNPGQNH